jgi:broad specificity phosphatase PhoE
VSAGLVYLVRHGKAGDRAAWTGDDRTRPLSTGGRRQAEWLVAAFRGADVSRVLSSPHTRCVETVRPLALDRGLEVEEWEALAEGAPLDEAMHLLTTAGADAVLCSHGDMIPALVDDLAGRGMRIEGQPGWKKGSTWILEIERGRFARARYVPPLPDGAGPSG